MDDGAQYNWLRRIGEQHGKACRGKILQRLLELAFSRADYRLVDERISEGIDFDVVHRHRMNERYSFEARTSEDSFVTIRHTDLVQLDQREKDGYQIGLAALKIAPGARWIFVERGWLLPPYLRVSIGNSPNWECLNDDINSAFGNVLEELAPVALWAGLNGLEPHVRKSQA